jgi:hypothetical protein
VQKMKLSTTSVVTGVTHWYLESNFSRNYLKRLPLVTEDCLPLDPEKTYVRIRGQFWGRAAPASVILDKNPGALIFVPAR